MREIFRMCGNESQPGLELVEKLATPVDVTCNIQRCWELLANNVASVCTGLDCMILFCVVDHDKLMFILYRIAFHVDKKIHPVKCKHSLQSGEG